MTSSYRFIVSGRVQGVFYRQSALQQAQRLGLAGWVRNLPDGRVDGLAQGAAQVLEEFRLWLRQGPPAARVESVEWTAADEAPLSDFSIRPSIRA